MSKEQRGTQCMDCNGKGWIWHTSDKGIKERVQCFYCEADSVSRTKPAESASVIPQSPVPVDLEGNSTSQTNEWTVEAAWAHIENKLAFLISENSAHLETIRRLTDLKDRMVAAARENKDEADALRSQLKTAHEALGEARKISIGVGEYSEITHEAATNKIDDLLTAYFQTATPSATKPEAWFQEKVQPLVEALEKIRLIEDRGNPENVAIDIADAALAQLKPETKL